MDVLIRLVSPLTRARRPLILQWRSHVVRRRDHRGPAPLATFSPYGHVRRLSGLWVVDASIMPDVVRANTNATIIMMVERIADWIKVGKCSV
jgi:hypothetical protein